MEKAKIRKIVLDSTNEFLEKEGRNFTAENDFIFSGPGGRLDSIGLVNVVVDIENKFIDLDRQVTIASDQAFFSEKSPFKSISSLTDFIYNELKRTENPN